MENDKQDLKIIYKKPKFYDDQTILSTDDNINDNTNGNILSNNTNPANSTNSNPANSTNSANLANLSNNNIKSDPNIDYDLIYSIIKSKIKSGSNQDEIINVITDFLSKSKYNLEDRKKILIYMYNKNQEMVENIDSNSKNLIKNNPTNPNQISCDGATCGFQKYEEEKTKFFGLEIHTIVLILIAIIILIFLLKKMN